MRVNLKGQVVSNSDADMFHWFGVQCCCPQDIERAIACNPTSETLTLDVNSPGGDVAAGFEIYNLLRGAPCQTEAVIQGFAASAMSVAICGAGRVLCTPVSQVMIHLPSTVTVGNNVDHARAQQALDSITEGILSAYELKCSGKKTRAELRTMVENETWLNAQAAIDAGFADEYETPDDGATLSFAASADGYNLDAMRKAYAAHLAAEVTPPAISPAEPDITQTQMLAVERARYGGKI